MYLQENYRSKKKGMLKRKICLMYGECKYKKNIFSIVLSNKRRTENSIIKHHFTKKELLKVSLGLLLKNYIFMYIYFSKFLVFSFFYIDFEQLIILSQVISFQYISFDKDETLS